LRTLRNKLLLVMGDLYCFAWDVLKAEYPTQDEKREADRIALERMATASMQADALIAEMEARGYGIPKMA
jgi:hypothetical protein